MKLSLSAGVLFDVGKSELKPEGIAAIKKIIQDVNTISEAQITIEGHTDDTGNDEANRKLSLQRAEAVGKIFKYELKNKNGFTYIEIGKGESSPAVPNTTEENKRKNRRVEILINPK
jgi:outer membrane protein OmpA-like peptidoglycan-associated protein